MGGFAWVTLATNDSYSLGALVLGHSLRRVGTPHDLVVLVTPGVSAAMRNQLSSAFTVVQEVNVLDSQDEANLALLERPELGITFTKLHCWRLTQYEKCVFLDADTLVLKNSDELFEREELSAAPDPGWPDCFNSGVFVYRPSLDTFSNLIKFALSKGSFDGGDQGLLNLYFSDWATKDISRHLPFLYNMVSTATYSYLPAYKAFGEDAKIAHFIGPNKPWLQYFDPETRLVRPPQGSEHLQHLLQLWWDIFCSTVHPSLSPDMLGLAGALAQVTLGVPRSAEQTAFEEHVRKQAWEQGSVDYMGRDSFDNIWRKITDTLAQAPPKPVPHKAVTEVTTTKPTSEPTLPEPKSTTLSPTGAGDASAITSSTATLDSEPSPPKSTDPSVPSVPLGGLTPSPFPGEQPVPRTPSVTEATPPTSPPIVVPTADSKALKVDVEPLETPPVGSTPTKLLSEEQVPSPATQVTQVSESHLQTETTSVAQQEVGSAVLKELGPVEETKAREQEKVPSSPQQTVPTQEEPEALVPSETKSSEAVLVSQQTLPAQESPVAPSTPQPPPIPEVPVTPSIPQEAPTQGSPVVPVGLSTPEQSPIPGVPVTPSVPQVPPTQEGPVAQSTSQPTPTTERSVSPVILSTSEPSPVPEVPVTPSIPEVSSTQESHSASVPLSTPEPTHMQRSPAASPTPQQTSTQDAPAVPVFPQQPSSAQDSSAAVVVPPTPQQLTPTQETLAAPVSKPVEQKDPPSIQQQLPPTPPASPGTVGTKPSEASPEKTEVKPTEQKESPLAPIRVEQPKDSTIPQTQEAVQQKAAASAPPLLPSQEVPVSTTTNKTPAISQTKPVEETPVPQLAIIKDQTVAAPVSPSPVPLPSAEMETIPLAVSVPAESASETPPSPMPLSKSKESPKASTIAEPVHEEATPTVPSKTEPSFVRDAPEREREMRPVGEKGAIVPPTQSKPAEPSKPVPSEPLSPPSTPDTSSSDQASVPSAQSKPEEPSKSVPSKPLAPASPPTTGDASPSDQAPVPPKRRGHKAAGTSTPDQGAATKPVAQSQQGKGSKQVQKGKK